MLQGNVDSTLYCTSSAAALYYQVLKLMTDEFLRIVSVECNNKKKKKTERVCCLVHHNRWTLEMRWEWDRRQETTQLASLDTSLASHRIVDQEQKRERNSHSHPGIWRIPHPRNDVGDSNCNCPRANNKIKGKKKIKKKTRSHIITSHSSSLRTLPWFSVMWTCEKMGGDHLDGWGA